MGEVEERSVGRERERNRWMGPILFDAGWSQFESLAKRIAASLFFKKANRSLSHINCFCFTNLIM